MKFSDFALVTLNSPAPAPALPVVKVGDDTTTLSTPLESSAAVDVNEVHVQPTRFNCAAAATCSAALTPVNDDHVTLVSEVVALAAALMSTTAWFEAPPNPVNVTLFRDAGTAAVATAIAGAAVAPAAADVKTRSFTATPATLITMQPLPTFAGHVTCSVATSPWMVAYGAVNVALAVAWLYVTTYVKPGAVYFSTASARVPH